MDFLGEKLKEHAENPVKIYQVGKYKRLNMTYFMLLGR